MKYTILIQWTTLDGSYHSRTVDKNDEDVALGEYHSMFKPMQNDQNVQTFILTLFDEEGNRKKQDKWKRKQPIVEEVEEPQEEVSE